MPLTWDEVVAQMKKELDADIFPRAVLGVQLNLGAEPQVAAIDVRRKPVWNESTIFSIGSMSKTFVAAGLLKLIEQNPRNYFGSDDPDEVIDKPVYLLRGMEELGVEDSAALANPDWERKRLITLRHLLTHTAAMRWFEKYDQNLVVPNNPASRGCVDASRFVGYTGSPGLTNECIYDYEGGGWKPARRVGVWKIARHVMHQRLLDDLNPGAESRYSNFDYILLARVIEAATGVSFNLFLKRQILRPLGMGSSFFMAQPPGIPGVDELLDEKVGRGKLSKIAEISMITLDKKLPPEVAQPEVADTPTPKREWDELRRQWVFAWPEGGMYSNIGDLFIFLRMLRKNGLRDDGEMLLTEKSVRLLLNPNVPPEGVGRARGDRAGGPAAGFVYADGPSASIGTGLSPESFKAEGRFMTFIWIDPVKKMSGVFLSQRFPRVVEDDGSRERGEDAINEFTERASQMR